MVILLLIKFTKILLKNHYLFLFNVTEKLFFFVFFLVIARQFSSEVYGKITVSFVINNTIGMILSFGIPFYLQREVAKAKNKEETNISEYIFIYINVSVLYLFLSLSIWYLFYNNINLSTFILITITVYFLNFSSLFYTVFSGLSKYKIQFYFQVISKITTITAILALFALQFNLFIVLLVLSFTSLINFIILFVYVNKHLIKINLKIINYKLALNKLISLWPLSLAGIFNFMYDKIDVMIISKYFDYSYVAFYSVAYGIYKSSINFFSFVITDAYTKISKIETRLNVNQILFNRYSLLILLISMICALLTFFFADIIVKLLYTDKYQLSIAPVKIMSLGILFIALNNYTGTILNSLGLFKENMIIALIGLLFNIILNIYFIPQFGIVAAAIITVITEFIIFAFGFYYIINR